MTASTSGLPRGEEVADGSPGTSTQAAVFGRDQHVAIPEAVNDDAFDNDCRSV
jgi:hypothetical protein